jgi:antitoxin VapB
MMKTSLFKNNQSQAVRLPKSLAYDESIKKVVITAIGKTRIISPVESSWDAWFEGQGVSDDFMNQRDQEMDQVREGF